MNDSNRTMRREPQIATCALSQAGENAAPARTMVFCIFNKLSMGFFFQAEDGIRDLTVTGVQTCALPICVRLAGARAALAEPPCECHDELLRARRLDIHDHQLAGTEPERGMRDRRSRAPGADEIGRASCRERV